MKTLRTLFWLVLVIVLIIPMTACAAPAATAVPATSAPTSAPAAPEPTAAGPAPTVAAPEPTKEPAGMHNGVDISKHRELTVITYSGSYQDIQLKNVADSKFEEEYNCKVTYIQATGAETIEKIRNKEADVVFTDMVYSVQGEKLGLFEKLEMDKITNLANLYDFARVSDYTLLHDIGAYGIAYNPKLVENAPEHWTDLWKDEYAGKLMLRSFRADSIELMIYMAKLNGGDEKNIDPGFQKMAEIAKHVHTWSANHSQTLELFRNGDVSVGMWTDGRVKWAGDQGVELKFVLPEEGGFLLMSTVNIVAGTENVDLALKYLDMEMSPKWQAGHSEALGYFPLNKEAYALLSDKAKSMMAFTPENVEKGFNMADWDYVVSVYSNWSERWEKEVLGKTN